MVVEGMVVTGRVEGKVVGWLVEGIVWRGEKVGEGGEEGGVG